jgi:hypothetical protein
MNMNNWERLRPMLKNKGISVAECAKRLGYSDTGLRAGIMDMRLKRAAWNQLAQMLEVEPYELEALLSGKGGAVASEPAPVGYGIRTVAKAADELDLLRALYSHRDTLQALIDKHRRGDE